MPTWEGRNTKSNGFRSQGGWESGLEMWAGKTDLPVYCNGPMSISKALSPGAVAHHRVTRYAALLTDMLCNPCSPWGTFHSGYPQVAVTNFAPGNAIGSRSTGLFH